MLMKRERVRVVESKLLLLLLEVLELLIER
jgi:hypothetical protein